MPNTSSWTKLYGQVCEVTNGTAGRGALRWKKRMARETDVLQRACVDADGVGEEKKGSKRDREWISRGEDADEEP